MDRELIEGLTGRIISEGLGLDLTDPNLKDTPSRIAKMFTTEIFSSVESEMEDSTVFPNEKEYDEIVMLDNIPFNSVCSHHFVFFSGLAWFLYIPDKWLIGASKVARTIDFFCKRPQLQENLSHEIMKRMMENIQPKGAMLVMRAVHSCMSCRGVKTGMSAGMMTSVTTGVFRDNQATREEGFDLIKLSAHL